MRVAVFDKPGRPIRIDHIDIPRPGPDDILVKVCRCGICGSDVSMTGEAPFTFQPGPIGHEYAGEVVEVGGDVSTVRVGQRVTCLPIVPCGACDACRRTRNPVFCTAPLRAAAAHPGAGFGEYVALPASAAIVLPDSLSFADGALVEPMACGLHALRMAGMARDSRLLVLGAGTMALSVIYWARRLGAGRIVVASRSARRRAIAMAMGADAYHSFDEDDPATLAPVLGGPADLVAECVGKQGMLNQALDHVRPQGAVISLGMCMATEPLMPAAATFREARLYFPLAASVDELIETARAFDADAVPPELMVSDVIALEQLPAELETMRAGRSEALKVQVDPWKGLPGV